MTSNLRTNLSITGTAGLAFCGVLVETSMNVTFPTLSRQFGTTINAVQWVTTAYLLVVACTMVVTAFLQRRFRWQRLVLCSTLLFVIGDVACALATQLVPLLLGRVIQGVATGLAMPLVFAIIMRQVPHERQGRYVGTAGMVVALAPSLGPTYGGWVTESFGWPLIFWLVLPVGIMMGLLAVKSIAQPQAPQAERFPGGQFLLILLAFVGLTLGLNNVGALGLWQAATLGPLIVAVLAFSGFVYCGRHQQTMLINLAVFTNGRFVALLLIYFLIQFVQIGLTFVLPTYAQLVNGQSVMIAGAMLLAGSLASAVLQPMTGRLIDRGATRSPFMIGSGLLLIAIASLFVRVASLTVGWMLALYLVYMVGFSLIFNNALTLALQQLQPQHIGDGNATFNTLQQYAGSLGTALPSALLAAFASQGGQRLSTIAGTRASFLMMGVAVLVILLLSLSLPRRQPKNGRGH